MKSIIIKFPGCPHVITDEKYVWKDRAFGFDCLHALRHDMEKVERLLVDENRQFKVVQDTPMHVAHAIRIVAPSENFLEMCKG